MTRVEGTPYLVQLGADGYYVMLATGRPAVAGGAPIVLEVAGPYASWNEAVGAALSLTVTRARIDADTATARVQRAREDMTRLQEIERREGSLTPAWRERLDRCLDIVARADGAQ